MSARWRPYPDASGDEIGTIQVALSGPHPGRRDGAQPGPGRREAHAVHRPLRLRAHLRRAARRADPARRGSPRRCGPPRGPPGADRRPRSGARRSAASGPARRSRPTRAPPAAHRMAVPAGRRRRRRTRRAGGPSRSPGPACRSTGPSAAGAACGPRRTRGRRPGSPRPPRRGRRWAGRRRTPSSAASAECALSTRLRWTNWVCRRSLSRSTPLRAASSRASSSALWTVPSAISRNAEPHAEEAQPVESPAAQLLGPRQGGVGGHEPVRRQQQPATTSAGAPAMATRHRNSSSRSVALAAASSPATGTTTGQTWRSRSSAA